MNRRIRKRQGHKRKLRVQLKTEARCSSKTLMIEITEGEIEKMSSENVMVGA